VRGVPGGSPLGRPGRLGSKRCGAEGGEGMSGVSVCEGCMHDMRKSAICGEPYARDRPREAMTECWHRAVRVPAAETWQSGSTAPKDGSKILCLWDSQLIVVYWNPTPDGPYVPGYWESSYEAKEAPFGEPDLWAAIRLPEATKR